MSQGNVDIVRSLLAAVASGGVGEALEFADPGIIVDASRNVLNPGTYVGTEGLRRWQADLADVWDEIRVEPVEFIDAGARVVMIGRLIGKGKGSGVEVTRQTSGQIATVRNGCVVRWEIGYTTREEALEAAGLIK